MYNIVSFLPGDDFFLLLLLVGRYILISPAEKQKGSRTTMQVKFGGGMRASFFIEFSGYVAKLLTLFGVSHLGVGGE